LYTPRTGDIVARRDFKGLRDIAIAIGDLAPEATFAVLEFVGARPGQGVCSMFSFGRATGVAIGALEILGLPWCDVAPQTWQRWVRDYLGVTREDGLASCEAALRCSAQPHHRLFSRKKDHNSADAFLMALWGSCRVGEGIRNAGRDDNRVLPPLKDLLAAQAARKSPGR
jgi:hypothetical protein